MGRAQFIIDNPGLGLSSKLTDCGEVFYGDGLSKFGWDGCAQFAILLEKYSTCQGKLLDFYDLDKKKLGEG